MAMFAAQIVFKDFSGYHLLVDAETDEEVLKYTADWCMRKGRMDVLSIRIDRYEDAVDTYLNMQEMRKKYD